MYEDIPLWMTSKWGESTIATKNEVLVVPFISLGILLCSYFLLKISKNFYQLYLEEIVRGVTTFSISIFTIGLYLIIRKSTNTNIFFLDQLGSELLNLLFLSTITSLIATPIFIRIFKKFEIITDPKKHQHPGMILKYPSARGGGLVYSIIFGFIALIFTKFSPLIISLVLTTFLCSIVGILDDLANTSGNKKFKIFGSPIFRLFALLPIPIIILVLSGIKIETINIPFYGILELTTFSWYFLGFNIYPVSAIFTFIWVLWIINLLSWSNGVDGQYSGIVVIASLVIGFLSLRFLNLSEIQTDTAKLAFISAGVALGILPFTWNPSKIMWGFGAISAGVVLASLSILASTKISISILVLLIPFLDAIISIIRRILKGQNPLKGDRSHLHHLLLNRGWSVKQIAVFYWFSTSILGIIAYFSSEKDLPLIILTLGGVIGFIIVLLNLKLELKK